MDALVHFIYVNTGSTLHKEMERDPDPDNLEVHSYYITKPYLACKSDVTYLCIKLCYGKQNSPWLLDVIIHIKTIQ